MSNSDEYEADEDKSTKYFFASVTYKYKEWINDYKSQDVIRHRSDVFTLDHYPNEKEIIIILLGEQKEDDYYDRDPVVMSYNEMSKKQYGSYQC